MNVLVVGAGLSGMVLATALRRSGVAVDIVELPRLNGPHYPSCVGMMRPALHAVVEQAMRRPGCSSARNGSRSTPGRRSGERWCRVRPR